MMYSRRTIRALSSAGLLVPMWFVLTTAPRVGCSPAANTPTVVVEQLGNPAAKRYAAGGYTYAQNVWDLQAFDSRLYIGTGNANNDGPAPNAGPVDVWSYDPTTNQFASEYVAPDEQIGRFRLVNGELVIPGWDPQEDWSLGNFYRLRDGKWSKIRSIPRAIHTYDVLAFKGALFAANGGWAVRNGFDAATVTRSVDDGLTWTSYLLPGPELVNFRANTLFTLDDKLYVTSVAFSTQKPVTPSFPPLYVWKGNGFALVIANLLPDRAPVPPEQLAPAKFQDSIVWIDGQRTTLVRPANFRNNLIYIGATLINDHQWRPFGLYTAASIDSARAVQLAPGELPYDIEISDGRCFVLTNTPEQGRYLIKVQVSDDLTRWSELLRFYEPTFARSFAVLRGDIYFGLGCDTTAFPPETGSILRVQKASFSPQ
jgi:hypothetical protein